MPEDKVSEEEATKQIQEALERFDINNLPPEVMSLLEYFTELANDDAFLENLNKEIVKKYGE